MRIFKILILFQFINFSCDNKDQLDNIDTHLDYIIAGDSICDSVDFRIINPEIYIQGKYPNSTYYKIQDSLQLDINNDSIYDLKFIYRRDYSANNNCSECMPQVYVINRLIALNNNVWIVADSSGQYVKRLSFGETINNNSTLINNSKLIFNMCGNVQNEEGEWNISGYAYLGFKIKEANFDRYGWIRLRSDYYTSGIKINKIGMTN